MRHERASAMGSIIGGGDEGDQCARLRACVARAGVLSTEEFDAALAHWFARAAMGQPGRPCVAPSPYLLTGAPGIAEPAALRWQWDARRAAEFAAWCERALAARFGVTWQVTSDDADADGPRVLRLARDGAVARCDWRYLNAHRWAGAFCTIADRLLRPAGLAALELETGWFDVVLCLCRRAAAEELLDWFAEAE